MKKVSVIFEKFIILACLGLTLTALTGAVITVDNSASLLKRAGDGNYSTPAAMIAIAVGTVMFITLIKAVFHKIDNLSHKRLVRLSVIFFAAFVLISVFMVLSFRSYPTTDSKIIQGHAFALANGKISTVSGEFDSYFARYTNNDLLLVLTALFFKVSGYLGVSDFNTCFIAVNAVLIFISEIFAYLSVKKIWGPRTACKYLAMSVLQPTLYLMIPWVYSATICLPFITGAFYLGICIWRAEGQKNRIVLSIIFAVVSAVGYYLRPIVLIVAIALAVCAMIYFTVKKGSFRRYISSMVCCLLVFAVCFAAIRQGLTPYFDRDEDDVFPITHWVMMGLGRYGSWSSDDVSYTKSFGTKQEKLEGNIEEIKKRAASMGALGLIKHISAKQITTWSDGCAGHILRLRMNDKYNTVYKYITGDRDDALTLYGRIYRASVLLLICILLIKKLKAKNIDAVFMPILSLFGAMLFYLIWEAKHCYSVPFLFLMVMLAVLSQEKTDKEPHKSTKAGSVVAAAFHGGVFIAAVLLAASGIPKWTQIKYDTTDYSVYTAETRKEKEYKDFDTIEQSFYTQNSFDTVELKANGSGGKGQYALLITDANGKTVFDEDFTENDITENQILRFNTDDIKVNGRSRYTICIVNKGQNNTIAFYRENTIESSLYDGEFVCDGEKSKNDIVMNVYHKSTAKYMPLWLYLALFATAFVPYCAVVIRSFLKRKKTAHIDISDI